MGEVKAELRKRAETIDLQKREIDAKQAKMDTLEKEVKRLERDNRKADEHLNTHSANRNDRSDDISNDTNVDNYSEVTRVINVEATFYTAFCDTGCTGVTATGLDVSSTIHTPEGLRVIAVDPGVIPLGSTVRVTLANGDSFTAKASDTGGAIKGNRIDVLVSDEATAYKLGRQAATVEVISD